MAKHTARMLGLLALSIGGYFLTSRTNLIYTIRAATAERAAFTATLLTKSVDPTGVEQTQESTQFAVRSNGTSATHTTRYIRNQAGHQDEVRLGTIVDVAGRKIVGIDHFTRSLSTSPITQELLRRYTLKPEQSCAEGTSGLGTLVESGEEGTILGQLVRKTVTLRTDEHTKRVIRHEHWRAPALDCFVMRMIATSTDASGKQARVTTETVSVVMGEPEDTGFGIPQGYSERQPSEIFAEAARLRGEPGCKACEKPSTRLLDDAYQRRKVQR